MLVLGLAAFAITGLTARPVQARVVFGVGVGVPAYPYYYGPPPVYYGPPPVYYAPPPPVYYTPPPPVVYSSPAAQNWYYCDNPKGYYPTVPSCSVAWRQVAPPAPPAQ
jgi:hypothetical protein